MNKLKFLLLMAITLGLGACGGDGASFSEAGTAGSADGDGEDPIDCELAPTDPTCVDPDEPVIAASMGRFSGDSFIANQLQVDVTEQVNSTSLSAGGTTNLQVSVVLASDTSSLYSGEAVEVRFTSDCVQAELASIDPPVVTTLTGEASVTYVAQGCAIADLITAAATVGGEVLTANGTVVVAPADVNAIGFVGASPEVIGLQGTGGLGFDETSDVTFRVVDEQGDPVSGVDVSFMLDSGVGGIKLSPDSATSDAAGNVTTVVTSGTVATTVRVTATVDVDGTLISTQSSGLVVSTGLPDQNSFSWAVTCPNIEAWNYDGVENTITTRLADRFNNPVPDGTAVSFNTEGGVVESSCLTVTSDTQSGFCEATWTSASPRPSNGRVTVLATATGEETFYDDNGNGVFDAGDAGWDDIDEIFRDDNENGSFESGFGNDGFFFDFDNSSSYSLADGEFNGILCDDPARCEGPERIGIGSSGVIIMSGSAAYITDNVGGFLDTSSGFATVTFTIGDLHDQPMPAGTTVAFETTNGQLAGKGEIETLCTSFDGPLTYSFTVNGDETPSVAAGTLTVTTPRGTITQYGIAVSDVPPP
jgi:hypothetical protein